MKLEIYKDNKLPIYKQIVFQFESLIKSGELKAGCKLPTEKELCSENNISKGTVKRAFDDLEKKHYIKRIQGSGTFVIRNDGNLDIEQAEKMVEDTFDKLSFVNSEQIYIILEKELKRKFHKENLINVAWVDCSRENLHTVASQMSKIRNLKVKPLLLDDIRKDSSLINLSYDFVATSNYHYRELLYLLSEEAPPIEKLVLEVSEDTILNIARIDESETIGILYKSNHFVENIKDKFNTINKKNQVFSFEYNSDFNKFKDFISNVDALIVQFDYRSSLSGNYLNILDEFEHGGKKIIPFKYEIDKGSLYGFTIKMQQFYKKKYERRDINGF